MTNDGNDEPKSAQVIASGSLVSMVLHHSFFVTSLILCCLFAAPRAGSRLPQDQDSTSWAANDFHAKGLPNGFGYWVRNNGNEENWHGKKLLWAVEAKLPGSPSNDAAEGREGLVSLFSGQALKDWRQCGPGHFEFTNGVATGTGGMGLWWYAGRQFTNFVLRGEFLQEQEIADSGVFLRFPDPQNDPWNAVHQGHEMEIGDPHPNDPTWRTGSIYPFKASIKANTKPLGQWNEYEITCVGQDYTVRMNGDVTMTWTDPKHRTDYGYIGLQNYNDGKTVRHRKLRIKELPLKVGK